MEDVISINYNQQQHSKDNVGNTAKWVLQLKASNAAWNCIDSAKEKDSAESLWGNYLRALLQQGRQERNTNLGNALAKGGGTERFLWWALPPSLPVWGGQCQHGMGHRSSGHSGQEERHCCRSESGLFCVSEIPRSTALLVKFQQVWSQWDPREHSPVSKIPAGADPHFSSQVHPPPSPYWREMLGGFIKSQWRRKGWGLSCTSYSQSSSALCIFLSCLKVSTYLYIFIFIYICAQCNQVTFETVSWAANSNFQEKWKTLTINT